MSEPIEVGPDYERSKCLGSSDIAGVMGISPWKSRVGVWVSKTTDTEETVSAAKRKLFKRGKRWESVVAEMLVEEFESLGHKVTIVSANKRYRDGEYAYMTAEVDYEITMDDSPEVINVECKTASLRTMRDWGPSGSDYYPTHYAAQGMYGLMVTGREYCILAPLFGADELRVYPIVRDDVTIAGMREQARLFWELHVLTGIAPDAAGLDDVNLLYKTSTDTMTFAEPWLIDKMLRYREADAEISAREAERDVLEYEIKRFMQTSTQLLLPGESKAAVTWKTQKTSRLDMDAFKAEYPKLYKQFSKESTTRVFRMNNFNAKDQV